MVEGASSIESPLGRVALLGLGVMGGSLARAVAGLQLAERITGWSPESTERDAALTAGALTFAAAGWRECVAEADLVVVAAPLRATCDLIRALPEAVRDDATITDVASLKGPTAQAARDAGLQERWVGSHPMAGEAASGFWASRDDLYAGATVWLVAEGAADDRVRRVARLWEGVGARTEVIGAREHDRLMALASHLPQLVSNGLAEVLEKFDVAPDRLGPGGRDMVRLAASNPDMWHDLLEHATPELVSALRAMGRSADRLAEALEDGDVASVEGLMRRTRAWRGRA